MKVTKIHTRIYTYIQTLQLTLQPHRNAIIRKPILSVFWLWPPPNSIFLFICPLYVRVFICSVKRYNLILVANDLALNTSYFALCQIYDEHENERKFNFFKRTVNECGAVCVKYCTYYSVFDVIVCACVAVCMCAVCRSMALFP